MPMAPGPSPRRWPGSNACTVVGGASLEFIQGCTLPGLAALEEP